MPRIAGIDIPEKKKIRFSLRYIFGIGPKVADEILGKLGIDGERRAYPSSACGAGDGRQLAGPATVMRQGHNGLAPHRTAEQQQQDANLLQMHQRRPELFFYIPMEGNIDILVFVKQGDDPNTAWRIALPRSMVQMTIQWFHEILGHCGSKRLRLTLNQC